MRERSVVALFVSAVVLALSSVALATGGTVTYNSPYGTAPVDVYVGQDQVDGNSYVVYRRKSDGVCTRYQVGVNGTGNVDKLVVNGSSGNDYLEVVNFGTNTTFSCYSPSLGISFPYTFRSPQQSTSSCDFGYPCTITVNGGAGSDTVSCGGMGYGGPGHNFQGLTPEPIVCRGGDGNDYLIGQQPYVMLYGDGGDDKVISAQNYSGWTYVFGGDGNDCLSFASQAPWTVPVDMSCDAGTADKQVPYLTSPGCELQASSCF